MSWGDSALYGRGSLNLIRSVREVPEFLLHAKPCAPPTRRAAPAGARDGGREIERRDMGKIRRIERILNTV